MKNLWVLVRSGMDCEKIVDFCWKTYEVQKNCGLSSRSMGDKQLFVESLI